MEAIWRRGRVKAFLWRWIERQYRRREGKLVSALTDEVRAYRLACASEGEEATRSGNARDAQHEEDKRGVLRQPGKELELFSLHPPSQHQQALPQPRRPQPRPRLDDRGRATSKHRVVKEGFVWKLRTLEDVCGHVHSMHLDFPKSARLK
ncbi:hypothetical protein Naga_100279g5 [Nannochloropsis gaditana]|uniref:Uncharacterized protein n=1 Tax=Nannochloropsis gaditana TaxID=72520 RepID=W7TZ55_9STRA|nr:hypothetical protein Naga_100279g5 [Nannochloropsis gaditana]